MERFILMILLIVGATGCSIVGPQERGVRLLGGKASEVLDPGMHLWFPILYGIKTVNTSIQKSDIQTSAASKDLQEVTSIVSVNWSVSPEKTGEVYKTLGDEADALNRIVIPAVNEILKSATAKKTAEQVLTQRMELKSEIDSSLHERLAPYGLKLSGVNIVDLHFSPEFTKAIEEKQISEQHSQQSKYLAEKAINDAQAQVNLAKGQAEAQKLVRANLTHEILEEKAIEKWDGRFPEVVSGGNIPFLNLALGKNK